MGWRESGWRDGSDRIPQRDKAGVEGSDRTSDDGRLKGWMERNPIEEENCGDRRSGFAVCVLRSRTVRVQKVKHGMCMVGIIFPHTGSPTLRQMENRKGEQGEI